MIRPGRRDECLMFICTINILSTMNLLFFCIYYFQELSKEVKFKYEFYLVEG